MKKLLLPCFMMLCCLKPALAQTVCNSAGNLVIFTNYDGGPLNINVDVNVSNLKIGIVSYEAVAVNISGTYASNVTGVIYAGYNNGNNSYCGSTTISTTTISGAPTTATTAINFAPTSPISNTFGYGSIICGYSCITTTSQGGCNTVDQIQAYFQNQFSGSVLRFHKVQYGCWSGTQTISGGGNCCYSAITPLNVSTTLSTNPQCFGSCNGTATALASGGQGPYTYQWTGGPATASWTGRCAGTYTVTVTDNNNTTATQNVTLTQPAAISSSQSLTACKQYWFNGQMITASGTYLDTLQAANGCDSILNLSLTINQVNTGVSQSGGTLTANASGATYQWLHCDSNNKVIAGASSRNFTPLKSGRYALRITMNGCTDTSECIQVTPTSISNLQTGGVYCRILPNPAETELNISVSPELGGMPYRITDLSGRELDHGTMRGASTVVPVGHLPAGMYLFHIQGMEQPHKFMKK